MWKYIENIRLVMYWNVASRAIALVIAGVQAEREGRLDEVKQSNLTFAFAGWLSSLAEDHR